MPLCNTLKNIDLEQARYHPEAHITYIIYHISYITKHISYIIYQISHNIYHISQNIYHITYIIYHITYIIYHVSYIIYHISHNIYHISHNIYHISHNIYHISFLHLMTSVGRFSCWTLRCSLPPKELSEKLCTLTPPRTATEQNTACKPASKHR